MASNGKELYLVVLNSSYVGLTVIGKNDRGVIANLLMKIARTFGFTNFNDYLWCSPGFRINIDMKTYTGTRMAYEVKNDVGKTISVDLYKTKYRKNDLRLICGRLTWDPYKLCEDKFLDNHHFLDIFENNDDTFMFCVQPTIDEAKKVNELSSLNDNDLWVCSDWKE